MSSGNFPSGNARGAAVATRTAVARHKVKTEQAVERKKVEVIRNRMPREIPLRQESEGEGSQLKTTRTAASRTAGLRPAAMWRDREPHKHLTRLAALALAAGHRPAVRLGRANAT